MFTMFHLIRFYIGLLVRTFIVLTKGRSPNFFTLETESSTGLKGYDNVVHLHGQVVRYVPAVGNFYGTLGVLVWGLAM